MSRFLDNLLTRHTGNSDHVKPRLRSRFEPASASPRTDPGSDPSAFPVTPNEFSSSIDPYSADFQPEAGRSRAVRYDRYPKNEPTYSSVGDSAIQPRMPEKNGWQPVPAVPRMIVNVPVENTVTPQVASGKPIPPEQSPEPRVGNRLRPESSAEGPVKPSSTTVSSSFPASRAEVVKPSIQPFTPDNTAPNGVPNRRSVVPETPPGLVNRPATFEPKPFSDRQQIPTPPTIKVTIGRIEVRAITTSAPPAARVATGPKPKQSLDEYLKQRNKRDS